MTFPHPPPEQISGEAREGGAVSSCHGSQSSPSLCLQLTREFFTKELTKHYQGNNDTDVFSATWNSVMITVSGPRDALSPQSPDAQGSHYLAARALLSAPMQISIINQALICQPRPSLRTGIHPHSILGSRCPSATVRTQGESCLPSLS